VLNAGLVPAPPLRVGYFVSRFPATSETFVVREMDAVRKRGVEITLMSLFPARPGAVHEAARPWLEGLRRPGGWASARDAIWWLARRPLRLLGSIALVFGGYSRRPGLLVRALATVPIASSHARALRESGVEHLHAHFANYPALAAWVAARLTGIPYSFTAHAHDIFADQSFLARKVADARFVIAISEFNRRFLSAYDGADPPTPIHVVHCGVDPSAYEFRPRTAPASGPIRGLCVATLEEKKGHRVLLEALATGDADLTRLELDLVGDGPLRDQLGRLVAELGLADRVRFRGSRTEGEVRELLAAADLFVLPSVIAENGQMEGVPVALMEALASGVPTVSTRMSGIPELIEDGRTGFLAEPGDPPSLANALERAIGGSGLEPSEGRRTIETRFDVDVEGERLTELFASTAGASGPS
jgi:glycosyltransferase involved in cell wall biosynthesis